MPDDLNGFRRWLALFVLCFGLLMIVLDTTVVTVALPSIAVDLHIAGASLTWLLNGYALAFGGFLLLSGRLGDLYGPRRLFLIGIAVFTLASLACGLARTETALLAARAVQGLGGAAVVAVGLSLITNMFPSPTERAQAMAIYGFVCAAGGAVGQLFGGFVSQLLGWHWIFLVNLPIGLGVYVLCIALLPPDGSRSDVPRQLDIGGAITLTLASTTGIYALIGGGTKLEWWTSAQAQGLLMASGLLLLLFLAIETRVPEPMIPLRLFRARNFALANVVGALWAGGTLSWCVIVTLYLQRVLHYDPFHAGLSFAPATAITAVFSMALSAKVLTRFGIRAPLSVGLFLSASGLAFFARAPQMGTFTIDVLPGMILLGVGGGIASTLLLVAAMNDVNSKDSGLASGAFNMSCLLGGAISIAMLTSLAETRTADLQQSGMQEIAALNGGYHFALLMGAIFDAIAAAGALVLCSLRPPSKDVDEQKVSALQEPDVSHALSRLSD